MNKIEIFKFGFLVQSLQDLLQMIQHENTSLKLSILYVDEFVKVTKQKTPYIVNGIPFMFSAF